MKIKITEPGWAGYTGYFGTTEFADGVSVRDVSTADAAALAALVRIEDVETGRDPSAAQTILDNSTHLAPVQEKVLTEGPKPELPSIEYTKDSLEQIADKFGIKGVREIGDNYGVRGTSIGDLIEKILAAQSAKAAEAAKAPAPAPAPEAGE